MKNCHLILFVFVIFRANAWCDNAWQDGFGRYKTFCEHLSGEILEIAHGNFTADQMVLKLEGVVNEIDTSVALISSASQYPIMPALVLMVASAVIVQAL